MSRTHLEPGRSRRHRRPERTYRQYHAEEQDAPPRKHLHQELLVRSRHQAETMGPAPSTPTSVMHLGAVQKLVCRTTRSHVICRRVQRAWNTGLGVASFLWG